MAREFLRAYLMKVAMYGLPVALLVLIPPAPDFAKIAGILSVLIVMFLAQFAELLIVLRNTRKQTRENMSKEPDQEEIDSERRDDTGEGTRREWRRRNAP